MSETQYEIRALRVMVEELRSEAPPELPWDAMEQRIFAKIAATEPRAPVFTVYDGGAAREPPRVYTAGGRATLPRVFGLVAVAAAVALGITAGSRELPTAGLSEARRVDVRASPLAPGQAGARGERDLTALRAGDVLEAGAEPVTFARAGLVTWTLAPDSRARVRSMGASGSGAGHTVALERGSIRAEVTPRDASEGLVEAFAVEVGRTRVAVHGTAFSVTIAEGDAIVDVDHGVVAIGPVGHTGTTTGRILVGPARARFSLDGGRSASLLPREPPVEPVALAPVDAPPSPPVPDDEPSSDVVAAAPPAVRAKVAVPPAGPVSKPVEGGPGVAPPPVAPLLTERVVRARVEQCFERTYEAGSLPQGVTIASTLRLTIDADGSVRQARFEPPLKPELMSCAGSAIAGRFAEGARSISIPFSFQR